MDGDSVLLLGTDKVALDTLEGTIGDQDRVIEFEIHLFGTHPQEMLAVSLTDAQELLHLPLRHTEWGIGTVGVLTGTVVIEVYVTEFGGVLCQFLGGLGVSIDKKLAGDKAFELLFGLAVFFLPDILLLSSFLGLPSFSFQTYCWGT